jgi:KaiC/GvpD/RAD55 family RecA-like ATPase
MAKRFECPRCGAGLKPDDKQCFRCGEYRVADKADHEAIIAPSPPVSLEVVHQERVPAKAGHQYHSPAVATSPISRSAKPITDLRQPEERGRDLERKEKELSEKEKAIRDSVEQLEQDTRALEEAIRRFEQEDAETREREQILKAREKILEGLAVKMEEALKEVEARQQSTGQMTEDMDRLKHLSTEYAQRISEERGLQKRLLDREIEERMERLKILQGLIAVAGQQPEAKTVEDEPQEDLLHRIEAMAEKRLDPAVMAKAMEVLERAAVEQEAMDISRELEIISTHDERLDYIMGGGIPAGHVVLVNGCPGSMKSTLSYFILYNAATKSNKRGMYFSLEQKRESIMRQMDRMGMLRAETEKNMVVVDMVDLRKAMQKEKGDWREIMMRYVKNVHSQMPFDIFVLDSLDSFKGVSQFSFGRQDMKDLFDWFKELKITVLIITEKPVEVLDRSKEGETYLADGVIELLLREFDDAKVYRWLRCVKMRGLQNDSRYYAFYHNGQEFKFSLPLVDSGK